ncbi:hypothetical protein BKA62DRAFT_688828 [Auriculariales sp. MPI-PUGE-AT-0066]|nr:hypothetical protein BKA62DRAFT_688828 [Auriculariales sp. MPI-PUGE-AT-0066]
MFPSFQVLANAGWADGNSSFVPELESRRRGRGRGTPSNCHGLCRVMMGFDAFFTVYGILLIVAMALAWKHSKGGYRAPTVAVICATLVWTFRSIGDFLLYLRTYNTGYFTDYNPIPSVNDPGAAFYQLTDILALTAMFMILWHRQTACASILSKYHRQRILKRTLDSALILLFAASTFISLLLRTITVLRDEDGYNKPSPPALNLTAAAFAHISVAAYAMALVDMVATATLLRASVHRANHKDLPTNFVIFITPLWLVHWGYRVFLDIRGWRIRTVDGEVQFIGPALEDYWYKSPGWNDQLRLFIGSIVEGGFVMGTILRSVLLICSC